MLVRLQLLPWVIIQLQQQAQTALQIILLSHPIQKLVFLKITLLLLMYTQEVIEFLIYVIFNFCYFFINKRHSFINIYLFNVNDFKKEVNCELEILDCLIFFKCLSLVNFMYFLISEILNKRGIYLILIKYKNLCWKKRKIVNIYV